MLIRACRRSSGFTLIEVMVALVIVAMALALGVPAFSVWIQNTQIRAVTESIQNGLQVARNEALRRNGRVEFLLNPDSSWTVTALIPGGADVQLQERTAEEGASSNIAVASTPVGASRVTFDGLGRVVDVPPDPIMQVQVSSAMSGTRSLRVQIGIGGQIRMCDPDSAIASTDPRYCQP